MSFVALLLCIPLFFWIAWWWVGELKEGRRRGGELDASFPFFFLLLLPPLSRTSLVSILPTPLHLQQSFSGLAQARQEEALELIVQTRIDDEES